MLTERQRAQIASRATGNGCVHWLGFGPRTVRAAGGSPEEPCENKPVHTCDSIPGSQDMEPQDELRDAPSD